MHNGRHVQDLRNAHLNTCVICNMLALAMCECACAFMLPDVLI